MWQLHVIYEPDGPDLGEKSALKSTLWGPGHMTWSQGLGAEGSQVQGHTLVYSWGQPRLHITPSQN